MTYALDSRFMANLLAVAILALTGSLLAVPLATRLGPRLGAMDTPKPLSIHSTPTPRTGGLAVLAGFLLAVGCGGFSAICGFVTLLA